jgi:hypothetical protein
VKAGLLPKASVVSIGFGKRATVQATHTGRQLLSLCQYRYDDELGRHDLVGAQMWLDWFEMPTAFVRGAIHREFGSKSTRRRHDVVSESFRVAKQRQIIDALPNLSFDDRVEVIRHLDDAVLGGHQLSPGGLDQIALAVGMETKAVRIELARLSRRITRADAARVSAADDESLSTARHAWSYLAAQTLPDQHKNGRTRARNRLGQFVGVFLLNEAITGPKRRSADAPLSAAVARPKRPKDG